ncbi:MAG: DUF481 domain-containing protein [Hahellaceae bacterium]|nr:DUF481 domain-containing protein [Hahellaceae bacterium]MCP5169229.1 DUF481 domain-containing protein [Hahellaceae bacterium]
MSISPPLLIIALVSTHGMAWAQLQGQTPQAPAQPAENASATDELPAWSGEIKLGWITVRGNSESSTFSIKNKWIHNSHDWRQTYKFDAYNQVSNEQRTGEKYFASIQGDKKLEEQDYIFALAEYENNRFGGFAYEFLSAAGYGREIFDTTIHRLVIEFGPAWRQREENKTHYEDKNLAARMNINYAMDISPTATFTEEFTGELGNEKNVTRSLTQLTTQINASLAMSLAYAYRRSSVVPAGRKTTDTETTVSLNYRF